MKKSLSLSDEPNQTSSKKRSGCFFVLLAVVVLLGGLALGVRAWMLHPERAQACEIIFSKEYSLTYKRTYWNVSRSLTKSNPGMTLEDLSHLMTSYRMGIASPEIGLLEEPMVFEAISAELRAVVDFSVRKIEEDPLKTGEYKASAKQSKEQYTEYIALMMQESASSSKTVASGKVNKPSAHEKLDGITTFF